MNTLERFSVGLRHSPLLRRATWMWALVRPVYDRVVHWLGKDGLERKINGTDSIRILPRFRNIPESYEPEVWPLIMASVRAGDVVVDVGAYIGLYALALGKRVGPAGQVFAFEPTPDSFQVVLRHVELNGLQGQVRAVRAAVGRENGTVSFSADQGIQASMVSKPSSTAVRVECVTLDSFFPDARIDILKIDVEGFEEDVLKGARTVLSEPGRRPRRIFIEVHPYAWKAAGTTDESLRGLLNGYGYDLTYPDGSPVTNISAYGEIVAQQKTS
jgi:FkbM family methyltransferase